MKATSQAGKGSSRRREDARKLRANWDLISWRKKPLDTKPKT